MAELTGRLPKRIQDFTFIGDKYFEPISNYQPNKDDYFYAVKDILPEQWRIGETEVWYNDIWCQANPPNQKERIQGFKIQLSAVPKNALKILKIASRVCVKQKASFKFLCDERILKYSLTKRFSRGGSGKFIVVYPDNLNHFKETISLLHEKTKGLDGPYILSDKNYKGNNVLFYRYSAFQEISKLNIKGEHIPCKKDPEGRLIPDVRTPYYSLPYWVEEPFDENTNGDNSDEEILFNDIYDIEKAIALNNTGGVYEAKNIKNNEEAILKEARPNTGHIDVKNNFIYTQKVLKNEYKVLQELEEFDFIPTPHSFFKEWKHSYLAMEKMSGESLASLRAQDSFSPYISSGYPTSEDLSKYFGTLIKIFDQALDKVNAIHSKNIIVGDIAPQNFLYDEKEQKISIIDFEGAISQDSDLRFLRRGNLGYVSDWEEGPSINNDYYSLGMIFMGMFYPMQSLFELNPDSRAKTLSYLEKKRGVLPSFIQLMEFLFSNNYSSSDQIYEHSKNIINNIRQDLSKTNIQINGTTKPSLRDINKKVPKTVNAIIQSADPKRNDRLFPADYKVFMTNPLSLSYGALGTLVSLQYMGGEIKPQFIDWVSNKKVDNKRYAPGFFVGSSGIAYCLYKIGLKDLAINSMRKSNNSNLKDKSADLFYGAAGIGLANLFFYRELQNDNYLEEAINCLSIIEKLSEKDPSGAMYFNNINDTINHGVAFGSTGISLFLLKLYQATKEKRHLKLAKSFLEFDISEAKNKNKSIGWTHTTADNTFTPYWSRGASGIGSVLIRLYSLTKENKYKRLAEKVAETLKGKDAKLLGLFYGKTGLGEFFVDMYQHTGKKEYFKEAKRIGQSISVYELEEDDKILFPAEDLIRVSMDYGTGAGGIGAFLSRVGKNKERLIYDS